MFKKRKNGNIEMDLETYKVILKDAIYGEDSIYLTKETVQKVKAKLKEIEELEKSNTL